MKLKEAIDRADKLRPNAYTYEQKTDWINELEHLIQARDFLVRPRETESHTFFKRWDANVTFPDRRTIRTDVDLELEDFDTITISDLETTTENNGTYLIYLASKYEYVVNDEVFTATTEPEHCVIEYNGTEEELLVEAPWDELYVYYLLAQIDYNNGDYDRYANSQETFENKYKNFRQWFTQHYCNDRGWKYAHPHKAFLRR